MNLGRFNMEKLDSILKKIIIFLLITGLTFLMLDISFTELETVRSQKINKEQDVFTIATLNLYFHMIYISQLII